jgi:hypothetical protein
LGDRPEEVGPNRYGAAVTGNGPRQIALRAECIAQVAMGLGVVGPEFQSTPIAGDGLGDLAQRAAGFTQIAVKGSVVRVQADGAFNQIHGLLVLAKLMRDDARQVQRLGVIRLQGENLLVKRFGRSQPPRLMVLQGQGQDFAGDA